MRVKRDAPTPPAVLREYALLADGERGALVGPRGDVAWLCAPRWDSGAVFSSLIGGESEYAVRPAGRAVWGGYYEDGTLVWHSRWATDDGIVESRDALGFPADEHCVVLLRRLTAMDCETSFDVVLRPRADYDRIELADARRASGVWTGRLGKLRLRWSGAPDARATRNGTVLGASVRLTPGEHRDLVLEISDRDFTDDPPDADIAWRTTETTWHAEIPRLDDVIAPRDARHTYAVMRGLTSTGGTVAAATTSLPERAEASRNYDYRYVWLRDQCYVGHGVAACGPHPLLDSAVDTVAALLHEHGSDLAPAYTTRGVDVPPQRHLDLPGYPGGYDIVGNQVRDQFQLDAFGEALLLFADAGRLDRLTAEHRQAAEIAANAIAKRWREPDAGIWELDAHPWTHSRLIAAAGLRAMAGLTSSGSQSSAWLALADQLVADTAANATHASGRWQRAADDEAGDAALLLPGLRGAVPLDDPRSQATLDAYLHDLTAEGYAYRFRHDDRPLSEAEGSFLLCGFLVALTLHERGDNLEARAWFERTRAACGPPQLFTEEFDAVQHQLRANLPQAFVHAMALECAARLAG